MYVVGYIVSFYFSLLEITRLKSFCQTEHIYLCQKRIQKQIKRFGGLPCGPITLPSTTPCGRPERTRSSFSLDFLMREIMHLSVGSFVSLFDGHVPHLSVTSVHRPVKLGPQLRSLFRPTQWGAIRSTTAVQRSERRGPRV